MFVTFEEYLKSQPSRHGGQASIIHHSSSILILRHDVDKLPENSLATAKIEKELGIKGSYYFRIVPVADAYGKNFDERIIKQIADLGHEIGYHYEEIDTIVRSKTREERRELKRLKITAKGESRQWRKVKGQNESAVNFQPITNSRYAKKPNLEGFARIKCDIII